MSAQEELRKRLEKAPNPHTVIRADIDFARRVAAQKGSGLSSYMLAIIDLLTERDELFALLTALSVQDGES